MEIKKAFEKMKKDLEKETGIKGGFVMNKRQIEKRTATYFVCRSTSYEYEIDECRKTDMKVQAYDTWTAEEKASAHKRMMESIEFLTELKEKYGTRENEVECTKNTIVNSKAFKSFEETIGNTVSLLRELDNDGCYKLRFHY